MARRAIFLLFSLIIAVNCDQLSVLYSPKALDFRGTRKLNVDSLPDVFAASLGYSVSHSTDWDGLIVKDPFNMPSGAIVVVAEGLDSLPVEGAQSYELYGGSAGEKIGYLSDKADEHSALNFEIDLKESSNNFATPMGTIQPDDDAVEPAYLKPKTNKADADFLRQLAYLNGLSDLLVTTTGDGIPTVQIVRVSLEALAAAHGKETHADPAALTEARKLLTNALQELQVAAVKAFDGAVIVGLVTTTETTTPLSRSKRQATEPDYNFAKKYDSNYPVIFNIILWFSVVLVFSLLAISIAICTMDPGRDSIIYRMTSTRMKKDN